MQNHSVRREKDTQRAQSTKGETSIFSRPLRVFFFASFAVIVFRTNAPSNLNIIQILPESLLRIIRADQSQKQRCDAYKKQ
jgi:hypothetical protein